jgi:hypothetical protein
VAGESVGHDDSYDYAVVNINPEGYREWVMRYSLRSDQPVAVVADQSGHIFVTGYTMFDYDTEVMCTTIKYTDPTVVGIVHDPTTFPDLFRLEQNYPNPFNPKTVIKYQLPASSQVDLSIFNILGQKITTLVSEQQAAGTYEVNWDASGLASGMYFYKLETPANVQVQKMLLIK